MSYFPHYSLNGNIIAYTDEKDEVIAVYDYSAFGQLIASNAYLKDEFNFLFSTKYFDKETNLYYYGYRFYNPQMGRWINRDPLEEVDEENLYAFVANNPINTVDLLGLYAIDFHYYAIYYMLRAKEYSQAAADNLAGFSQYVDNNRKTDATKIFYNPKRSARFHFPGATATTPTVRNDPTAKQNLIDAFASKGTGRTARIGAALHTYADSWGHEGFTPWWNTKINARTGSWRPNIGHADTAEGGLAPDMPYNDIDKAIDAAKNIYANIPSKSACPEEFKSLEQELRQQFSTQGDNNTRVKAFQNLISEKFNQKAPIYKKEKFAKMSKYFEKALGI